MFLLSVLCTGCTTFPIVVLYNNTGSDLLVITGKNRYALNVSEKLEFEYPAEKEGTFEIQFVEGSWQYVLPYSPKEYYEVGVLRGKIKVQIENDGRKFIPKPLSIYPFTSIPQSQPEEFPLLPQKNLKSRQYKF